jgi:hypothetical protein
MPSLRALGAGPALIFISRDLPAEAAPALRLLQSWAPRNLAFKFIRHLQKPRFLCYTSRHAQQTPSLLWRGISALHHHQLLSAPAAAWRGAGSRSAAAGFGARAAALSHCGVVVRTGARCRPLRGLRFGVWKLTPDLRPGLLSVVPCGTCTAFVSALSGATLLRLRGVHREKAD